nr:EpsG family protein [Planococcus beigongshangi]
MLIIILLLVMTIVKLILYKRRKSMIFIFIMSVLLFLIASLKSVKFAPDVINYINHFNKIGNQSTLSIWTNFLNGSVKDPFFDFLLKLFSNLNINHFTWLALFSFVFLVSIAILIYRYSSDFYLSYIAFISLGYFFFSLTGLRQSLAMAFIILSYKYLREKKFMPFLFIVLFASLFHSSALIFLIAYPLSFVKIGIKHLITLLITLLTAVFFGDFIRSLINSVGWNDSLISYAEREVTLNYSGFIIQLSIFIFCLIYKNKIIQQNPKDITFFNLIFIGLIFQSFTIVVAEFFRVSLYFSIFNIILITKAIMLENDKKARVLIYFLILFALVVYIFWSGTFFSYEFFWNDSFYM